ncbi:cell division protein FtsZ [Flavobacterium johnsoniae]|jgi:cell division protein FtsZ|uniref:Cell division protein FtsZ n=1 Tax=Flavobacterium johnsoniae (strain ATCC 17061 / DSM 2064 / JCM 8514 / BCRC 14874 / CCUG 350202 / NBRC 14942 / NCIMB 11054 / UW101) TaxID=376686 RepID=A5FIX1_FLAJ1|nr:cell division protein FtsZ [Flavobacterium johnsoniae]ABQ04846.1 cell division protein FtsZ [Flavobacterium johnsoniae UW101]OXG02953.1 cell division protein FtsZ [Flavobacterium johnsoniae UW101]WQG83356.1 cell division protein FtsZ [Flavobacterium johnsoniae UW101]SHK36319.1 cell division protein FtsZ [Flavobacterium johnsoniae]
MMSNSEFGSISFDLPKNQSNVIKVIGVGGGGSNAINHMFKQGIKGVDFIVCNTDSQALQNSSVPNKIQLGVNLTEGLGAGANPDVGQQSAIESIADIEKMLDRGTKMVFITAGMGGGTGTGAAPVIAQLAKEREILTVGIVTIPFQFEGKVRQEQALLGIEKLRKQVDSLIVINNNKLREVYGNLGFKAGFSKADEVLATASRGIAEVITHHYTQNIDLRDAKTVLANSGTAIMGSAVAEGENRAKDAIVSALDSPLLNDNKITGAKNVLLLIVSGSNEITLDEIGEINDHIQAEAGYNANIIMGVGEDESLGEAIAVTIIATGFDVEQQNEIVNTEPKKIIHTLEDEQRSVHNLTNKPLTSFDLNAETPTAKSEEKIVFELMEDTVAPVQTPVAPVTTPTINQEELVVMSEFIKNLDVTFEIVSPITDIDFKISTPAAEPVQEVKPVQQRTFEREEQQTTFSFDLPLFKSEPEIKREPIAEQDNKIVFELSNETRNIKVNDPVSFVPVTELSDKGIIKYSLEEYMEVENDLLTSKPVEKVVEDVVPEELNITLKSRADFASQPDFSTTSEVSPMELTIEETLRLRAEERRKKLKEFNYKFHNNVSRIDELEKEPAYKRLGIDLSNSQSNNTNSRISVGTDSNNDLQLRSNNSFLHDNVD